MERLTGVYKNLTHGIVALVYRCRPADGDTHRTAEAREVRWMTREEVQSAMSPAFAVRVLDAFDVHVSFARPRWSQPRIRLMRILDPAGWGAAASNTHAVRRRDWPGRSRSKAETYNVGEREWQRLLRGPGGDARGNTCCSVQSYVVNSSLDHAAMVGSNRSGT